MKVASLKPRAHLFVCTHRRPDNDPLGGGCRERGEAVFSALKAEASSTGHAAVLWVAKSSCLGICPRAGCTVGIAPGPRYLVEVVADDAAAIVEAVMTR
jgi:predicted metal-binding protein